MKHFHIDPSLQEKALELVKKEIMKRQPMIPFNTCTTLTDTNALDSRSATTKGILSHCFDVPRDDFKSATTPYDELNDYMALNVKLNEEDDILKFWLQQKLKFPVLFSIVRDFYAIPASNTNVERLFSSSKNTITDKRTSIGAEKVNKLLFLQKNLELLKSFDRNKLNEENIDEKKRKISQESSSIMSNQNDEQSIITTTSKKFKMGNEVDIVVCDDDDEEDKENNELDFF
ncbi:unnamed protein product [Adineta steineri]|uniref:HAT C-terminal dimerisation domain-containing protein n=1 Tax=Adineta steineri TaxID=433720 RepID=A0A813ST32_9BILA|nr:unnamed protein product [Adineta steineri]CAF4064134.1 unnamed protein product [Adineta steineri]